MSRIVIALGGNALGNTPEEQKQKIEDAAPSLVDLMVQGHEIILSHGNGPQVGMIQLAFDTASKQNPKIPVVELPECTAMSQGYIGFHLQNGIKRQLLKQGIPRHVATVITQVEVEKTDPAFQNPSKPIGSFYSLEETEKLRREHPDWTIAEDSGRGYRRMVPSPKPIGIVEQDAILDLLDHKFVVIACGGGGIPVVRRSDGSFEGIPAVIDKDFASAALADALNADVLFILTAVDRVAIHFGTPDEVALEQLSVAEAEKYCNEGQFGAGSMLPKVQAAIRFVKGGGTRKAMIASLEKAPLAIQGLSGTSIEP